MTAKMYHDGGQDNQGGRICFSAWIAPAPVWVLQKLSCCVERDLVGVTVMLLLITDGHMGGGIISYVPH
jgi:hypothetical protein